MFFSVLAGVEENILSSRVMS